MLKDGSCAGLWLCGGGRGCPCCCADYMVTLFIKRSMDVGDKTIYVSDPIWFDQSQPSARACWLNFMQEAKLCHLGAA